VDISTRINPDFDLFEAKNLESILKDFIKGMIFRKRLIHLTAS
jgi:hypothetical protein